MSNKDYSGWEEDYDDYKALSRKAESEKEINSEVGWIYVGIDKTNPDMAKIGMTTNRLNSRATASQNPHYVIVKGYKVRHNVPKVKIKEIENDIINNLEHIGLQRIPHAQSRRLSEWFSLRGDFFDTVESDSDPLGLFCFLIEEVIIKNYPSQFHVNGDGDEVCCNTVDPHGEIVGLPGNKMNNFGVEDLQCDMQGGCGERCTCGAFDKWLKR